MQTQQLIDVLHAQPFRPFRLHIADGRALDVAHTDFIARSPTGRSAVVYKATGTFEVIDLMLVTSIEILDGQDAEPTPPHS